MVQRPRFDSWLTEKATQNGAMVRTGVRIVAITEERDHVTLTDAEGNTYTARYVVGADGAKGIIGPKSGLRLKRQYGIAREIEIPFEGGWEEGRWHPKLEPGAAYLDYGTVKHGYAWIFPKRNCLSVGAGMLLPKQPTPEAQREVGTTLRHAIDIVLHSVGLTYPEGENAPPLWAHPIPYWTGQEPLTTASGRTLLVGDAAGVVQPLFGEGIQYAVRSGAVAAEHLIAGTTTEYTEAIRALFAEEFDAAARVGKVFHRTPYLSYRLGVKNPAGNRLVGRVMAGEAHFAILEKRIYERLKKPFG
jgi:flavin-dependent dehydrogenase